MMSTSTPATIGAETGSGHGGAIAEVGEHFASALREEKAERGDGPVRHGQRRDLDIAQDKRRIDHVRHDLDIAGHFLQGVEGVGERPLDLRQRFPRAVDGQPRRPAFRKSGGGRQSP